MVIASRKLDACEAVAAEVRASTGRRAEAVACHVGRWDDCDRLVAETLERLGRLDVLVNNAGMSPLYERLDTITEELYDKTFAVNLKGPFRLAVLAGTHMVDQRRRLDHQRRHHRLAGGQHQRAALRLRQGRAERPDRRPGRRVRPEGPGERDPPRARSSPTSPTRGRPRPARAASSRSAASGEPEEIAPLALHLASAASSFTTGAIIRVDGGITRKV